MVFCVILSEMRGIWIAIPFVTAVILWACVRTLSGVNMRRAVLAAAASVVIGVGLTGGMIWDRLAQFSADIDQIAERGDYDSSTGRRLLMYDAAWSAILEAPWSGYGIGERMDAVQAHVPVDRRDLVAYSHPHNGFLAALLDAGVTGLAALCLLLSAPVVIAAMAERDDIWRTRMAFALILTVGYIASGMTNILFEHDLMDSAFIVLLVLIAASVPAADGHRAQAV
jgi:O-antigen ligase